MKIISYIRYHRSDPMKKVPDPAGKILATALETNNYGMVIMERPRIQG